MTTDGRVTIPKDIRRRLRLLPGDKLSFSVLSDGTVVLRVLKRRLEDLVGMLKRPDLPYVAIEDMRVRDDDEV